MMNNQLECCICLGEILNKNVSITECNHLFHTSCLLKYNNKKCPICRQSLYKEDMKPIILVEQRTDEEFIQQPALIESYLAERNKIKKIMYKFIYIVSQIYVAIFLIFCLRIMCEILWLFIYESHMAVAKYLF